MTTTHDTYAERYMQPYVAPEDVPRVFTPAPPLADLQACMSTAEQPAPTPTSGTADASADNAEQAAPTVETRTVSPPTPTWCKVEDGHGEARFDAGELRAYLEATSDASWVIRDDAGNVVGIASVNLMREALAQGQPCANPES